MKNTNSCATNDSLTKDPKQQGFGGQVWGQHSGGNKMWTTDFGFAYARTGSGDKSGGNIRGATRCELPILGPGTYELVLEDL